MRNCCASVATLLLLLVWSGCRDHSNTPGDGYRKNEHSISLRGSESELRLVTYLVDQYRQLHPEVTVTLSGEGSAVGLNALINGEIDIANSSRKISSGEMKLAASNHIDPVPVIIAVDAVAIITHPHVGIDSLSMAQLAKIFSGEVRNWKELGGADLPVKVVGRNGNSGTYHFLLEHLGINGYAPGATIEPGNKEIIDAVSGMEGAVGYVNLGSVYDENGKPCRNVWVANLYIDGGTACSPYRAAEIFNGEYPLTRPLYQYVNRSHSKAVDELLQLELSDEVQNGLQSRGYFPITAIHRGINQKNGFGKE